MLAQYLQKIRADRVLSESARAAAMGKLAPNWNYENGAISKEFLFPDYEGANNFLLRLNDYACKINRTPKWRNVYNTVSVTLKDEEFDEVTSKEMEVAEYLDKVYDVTLNLDELLDTSALHIDEVMLPKVKRK